MASEAEAAYEQAPSGELAYATVDTAYHTAYSTYMLVTDTVDAFNAAGEAVDAASAAVYAACDDPGSKDAAWAARTGEEAAQVTLLRCLFGPLPFRPLPRIAFSVLQWSQGLVRRLGEEAYNHRIPPTGTLDILRLNVLADALEEAGADAALVAHLREPGPHWRGCHALDLLLGKS